MFDEFHDGKTCPTTTGDNISLIVSKTGMLVCIHKKKHLDREMIHKLR
jgi:hypothetical protein